MMLMKLERNGAPGFGGRTAGECRAVREMLDESFAILCLWYDECLNTKHWRYRMEEKEIDDRDRTASVDSMGHRIN